MVWEGAGRRWGCACVGVSVCLRVRVSVCLRVRMSVCPRVCRCFACRCGRLALRAASPAPRLSACPRISRERCGLLDSVDPLPRPGEVLGARRRRVRPATGKTMLCVGGADPAGNGLPHVTRRPFLARALPGVAGGRAALAIPCRTPPSVDLTEPSSSSSRNRRDRQHVTRLARHLSSRRLQEVLTPGAPRSKVRMFLTPRPPCRLLALASSLRHTGINPRLGAPMRRIWVCVYLSVVPGPTALASTSPGGLLASADPGPQPGPVVTVSLGCRNEVAETRILRPEVQRQGASVVGFW